MLRKILKTLIVIFLVIILSLVGLTIYISYQPLSLNSFIGTGNHSIEWEGGRLEFSKLELYFVRGYRVRLENAHLQTALIEQPADLKDLHVGLDTPSLFSGKLRPRNIIASGLTLTSELNSDGVIIAGMPIKPGTSPDNNAPSKDVISSLNDFHRKKSLELEMLAHLKSLHLDNSKIAFVDKIRNETWWANNLDVQWKNKYGKSLEMILHLVLHRSNDELPLELRFRHRAGQQTAQLDGQIAIPNLKLLTGYVPNALSDSLNSSAKLKFSTQLLATNTLSPVNFHVKCSAGSLHLPDVYSEDIHFKKIEAGGLYKFAPDNSIEISTLKIDAKNDLIFEAFATITSLNNNPQLELAVSASSTPIENMAKFVPQIPTPDLSFWLSNNLHNAVASDISFKAKGPLSDFPFVKQTPDSTFLAEFSFKNLSVNFFDKMPRGEELNGKFIMDRGMITITADSGRIDQQKISALTVTIGDCLEMGTPTILTVDGTLNGSTEQLLQLLSNAFSDGSVKHQIKGGHEAKVNISLPLISEINPDDVRFLVAANVQQATLSLPEYSAELESNAVTVEANNKKVSIKGEGLLNKKPANFSLSFNPLNKNDQLDLEIDAEVGKEILAKFVPENYLIFDGTTKASIKLFKKDKNQFSYDLLLGLDQAAVNLPLFTWSKSSGSSGKVLASGIFNKGKNTLSLEKLTINAPEMNISGSGLVALNDAKLSNIQFQPFIINGTDLAIKYDTGKISITGNSLDYKTIELPKSEGTETELPDFDLKADINILGLKEGDLYQVKLLAQRQNKLWTAFNFSTLTSANTKDKTEAILVFLQNTSELQVKSTDTGALLKSLGIKDNILGGQGTMTFVFPKGKELKSEQVRGSIFISESYFTRSPILLKILSWFSLQKWWNNQEGVRFEKVSLNFDHNKPLLKLKDINFTSSFITIFGDGTIDTESEVLELKGNAVSLQMVGRLAENVPLLGGLVSDVQKGIMGVGFKVKGTVKEPDVSFFNLPF